MPHNFHEARTTIACRQGMPGSLRGIIFLMVALLFSTAGVASGKVREAKLPMRPVVTDAENILRWKDTGEEATFFGVNYVGPFAYTYRALGYVKSDPQETIRQDILHLARMGVNAVRMHVWDCEVSDREGNLQDNVHLRLLDYLVLQCRERGIYVLLTPINWGGNGYPEADQPVEGFSAHYPKREMGANPDAVTASARFLGQFVKHVNRYTDLAYKDDPTILGFELVNEPWQPPLEKLRAYIETLAKAIRDTRCHKPLFYCASQSAYRQHSDVLKDASVEGVTFGWYPSGLVSHRTLSNNFLPLVDEYPFMSDPAFGKKAKIVYEFDAADVDAPCMYPAFARTFRSYGIQWATQFAYCPLPLAASNTPYPTHYLNLVYTPNKAVSMLIAAEAFHSLARGHSYGHYPESTRFGAFHVNYAEALSEMVTDRAFLYANTTKSVPPHPERLERIVGCGSSPVARYEGTGSYFLEKQQAGVWRLEVYPDAVRVDDPHGPPNLDREAVRVLWQTWPMTLHLPDLGSDFTVRPLNAKNSYQTQAHAGNFSIRPGIYLLTRQGMSFTDSLPPVEFAAPEAENRPARVAHQPAVDAVAGKSLRIEATIMASPLPETATLLVCSKGTQHLLHLPMRRERGYRYGVTIPPDAVHPGTLEYAIRVHDGQTVRTFPAGYGGERVDASPPTARCVFDANTLSRPPAVSWEGLHTVDATTGIVPGSSPTQRALRLSVASLLESHALTAEVAAMAERRAASEPQRQTRFPEEEAAILIRARALTMETTAMQVTFVLRNGKICQLETPLTPEWHTYRLPCTALRPETGWIVLHQPKADEIKAIRFTLRPYPVNKAEVAQGVEIESVAFGPLQAQWAVPVREASVPPTLFDASRDFADLLVAGPWGADALMRLVAGKSAGAQALSLGVRKFNGANGLSVRYVLDARWTGSREEFPRYNAVRVRCRAAQPDTNHVEISLIDREGRAWGVTVPLTQKWSDILVPLQTLRPTQVFCVPFAYPSHVTELSAPHRAEDASFSVGNIEAIQFSLRVDRYGEKTQEPHGIEIESVALARAEGK